MLTFRAAKMKDDGCQTLKKQQWQNSSQARLPKKQQVKQSRSMADTGSQKIIREKYFRDVKLLTIGEGTSEIQRIVIAREVLK